MSPYLIVYGVIAALAVVGAGLIYKKGYDNGKAVVEMQYQRKAVKIKGKMDNAKVPQNERDFLEDLRRRKF